ncbi:MAG: homoserine dehydrogenase [Candidatus Gygaella obscura]|nr:homoserine dehydrogenase [Candidatus Gygaella obscura]
MSNKVNIGLIGFGTIGSGVVKILQSKKSLLKQKTGIDICIKKICDKDLKTKRIVKVKSSLLTKKVDDIINDPSIDIVVELIGGVHPAKEIVEKSLRKGKYVVTANKALLCEEAKSIFSMSKTLGKDIYFEAAVAGGIPIIKSIKEGLIANKFLGVYGILNGTSNYILSLMTENDCSFAQALEQAKKKGYAESNPSLDVEGIDSAHKIGLLCYLAFGKFVNIKNILVEGISRVSSLDICYAKELGFKIKLLAIAKKNKDKLEVRVHPTLIPKENLLACVDGVYNGICLNGDLTGRLFFYGKGAGRFPTASSIVSDIVELTKNIKAGLFKSNVNVVEDRSVKLLGKTDQFQIRYYIRFMAIDKPGVLAKISGILGQFGISIASVTQKERKYSRAVPIVMITDLAKEEPLKKAIKYIDNLPIVKEKTVIIRMEDI